MVNRKEEQEIKDEVTAVHDAALQVCDGLREVHLALGKLANVAPFDIYMRIIREQQIPNVNVVIKIAQAVPDQPTYGSPSEFRMMPHSAHLLWELFNAVFTQGV